MEEDERKQSLIQKAINNGYEVHFIAADWILEEILDAPFYDFRWFADCAKSKMKPLVKKYSLARELTIKAAEIVLWSFVFNSELMEQKKRIKFIVAKAMEDSIDEKYEKEDLTVDGVRFTSQEYNKYYRQAKTRFFNLIDHLDNRDDVNESNSTERVATRNQAFEASYLCLRTTNPEDAFYILWGLIDQFEVWLKPIMNRYRELQGE